MVIAIYLRVSKDKKGGVSIDVQRETCLRWVEQHEHGAKVVYYTDDGKSAYTDKLEKRPAFQRLLNDAAAHLFDLALVYKFDRFARKRAVYFRYIDQLKDSYKIEVKSATESDDWLSVGLSGLMAEHYSRMLSARMKDVRTHEVRELRLHVGAVPVGYDRHKGVLIPNEEADGVKELGKLYATGHYSGVRLSEELNRHGYTIHGKRWTDNAIKEIVRCPIYAGFVTHKNEVFAGQHEPLWSADLWARIRQVTTDRMLSYPSGGTGATKHYALLTGIARCAQCGGVMVYAERTNGNSASYYRCRTANRRLVTPYEMTCAARKGYAPELEASVIAWLASLAALPGLIEAVQRELVAPPQTGPNRAAIETKLRKLARAYADGGYDDKEYEALRGALIAQLDYAPVPTQAIDIGEAAALLQNLPALFQEALPEERQTAIRALVSAVYVYRFEVYAIRPTPAGALFFEHADPNEWLKRTHFEVRCAPNENFVHMLKKPPAILAA